MSHYDNLQQYHEHDFRMQEGTSSYGRSPFTTSQDVTNKQQVNDGDQMQHTKQEVDEYGKEEVEFMKQDWDKYQRTKRALLEKLSRKKEMTEEDLIGDYFEETSEDFETEEELYNQQRVLQLVINGLVMSGNITINKNSAHREQ